MKLSEIQAQQRNAETMARKAAMTLAMASVRTPKNPVLPPLAEAAEAILKIAEIRAGTIPASDLDIIKDDVEVEAFERFEELIASDMPLDEAQKRAAEGVDNAEAGFHILLAKRAADAWMWAEKELSGLLRGAGLLSAGEQ